MGLSGRQRAQIQPRTANGIHPNAITQKGTTGFAAGWIATDDGHMDITEIMQDTQNDLIGQGRLSRAPGTGDSNNRCLAVSYFLGHFGAQGGKVSIFPGLGLLGGRDQVGHHPFVIRRQAVKRKSILFDGGKIHALNHMVDHSLKSHLGAVFR